jgi:hypothetical protein
MTFQQMSAHATLWTVSICSGFIARLGLPGSRVLARLVGLPRFISPPVLL